MYIYDHECHTFFTILLTTKTNTAVSSVADVLSEIIQRAAYSYQEIIGAEKCVKPHMHSIIKGYTLYTDKLLQ